MVGQVNAAKCLSATIEVHIPFHDVDPAGVVWHGNYFKYFELARCELLQGLDYNYRQMAESGLLWPVVDLSSRFHQAVEYDHRATVEARLQEWEYRLRIDYLMRAMDGTLVATGETVQVPVNAETRELILGAPRFLVDRIEAAMK